MIQLAGVEVRYGQREVLDGVSLRLEPGEVVLVSGPSGAGKSSLLRLLYAMQMADAGTVAIMSHDLAKLRRSSLVRLRQRIGVIPQEIVLLDHRSALDNVGIVLEIAAVPRVERHERAMAALEVVSMANWAHERASRLSTGQRRRVAIARALVGGPAVFVADEPSDDLDGDGKNELCAVIAELSTRLVASVIATNDPVMIDAGLFCGWRHVELYDGCLIPVDDPVTHNAVPVPMFPADTLPMTPIFAIAG